MQDQDEVRYRLYSSTLFRTLFSVSSFAVCFAIACPRALPSVCPAAVLVLRLTFSSSFLQCFAMLCHGVPVFRDGNQIGMRSDEIAPKEIRFRTACDWTTAFVFSIMTVPLMAYLATLGSRAAVKVGGKEASSNPCGAKTLCFWRPACLRMEG